MHTWLVLIGLLAINKEDLGLVTRAQTDFDRVEMTPIPRVPDVLACIQSQAALLPVISPLEVSIIRYRRGFCTLVGATISGKQAEYAEAAADFQKAIEQWPTPGKNKPPLPISSGLRVLYGIAKLRSGAPPAEVEKPLSDAVREAVCTGIDMSVASCTSLLHTGHMWLGWMAVNSDRFPDAQREFAAANDPGWSEWITAREAVQAHRVADALPHYKAALQQWASPRPGLIHRFDPDPDRPRRLFEYAEAQIQAKDYTGTISTLDESIKARPENAAAVFLRGRAKELNGDAKAALADFELASRTARADIDAPFAAGQAHLYRGIWLFHRKDYERAENEFAGALNSGAGAELTADSRAWRHMAAVAGGACGASAQALREAVTHVSPLFPRDEAQAALAACR